jgi:predicted alpha/beta hydrolase
MRCLTEELKILTADQHELAASLYPAPPNSPWLVINSAMGVHRRYYQHLATHLAAAGIGVVTYDYRGIGDSALRDVHVRLADWGQQDFSAVLRWVRTQQVPSRLAVLGHSVGGQIVGLAPEVLTVDAVIGVATQSGYWRHWSGWERAQVGALWYAAIPLLTRLLGHFPASRFGIGQDLPAGIARQWAQWGRDPLYVRSPRVGPQPQFYGSWSGRLRTYLIRGDAYASEQSVRTWHDWFSGATREFVDLGPRNSAGASIGHFGFFDPEIGREWWSDLAGFLTGQEYTAG